MSRVIELKTDPDAYDAVARGDKTHEIRLNDRGYQVGDTLHLRRTDHTGAEMRDGAPLVYSRGKPTLRRVVTHVQTGYGLAPGWAILSMKIPVY